MKRVMPRVTKFIMLFGFFLMQNIWATTSVNPNDIKYWSNGDLDQDVDWQSQSTQYLDVKPSGTLWGFVGKRAVAKGQALWPFGGDGVESVCFGILEAAGSYDKKTGYSAGLGVGYRKVFNGSYIAGAYLAADFNKSPNSFEFMVFNPGVELLNFVWDLRANAYIPIGGRNWFGPFIPASQLHNFRYINYTGNTAYDHLYRKYEETASGFDAEIGRLLPIVRLEGLKGFVGGYYFFMNKTDTFYGITGRIFYPFTKRLALEVRDSYDGVKKNILVFGLRYQMGGFADNDNKDNLGIIGRLTDPIENHLANYASGNSGVSNTQFVDVGRMYRIN